MIQEAFDLITVIVIGGEYWKNIVKYLIVDIANDNNSDIDRNSN